MVFSSVGGLSKISLLPFHHLKINNNNNNNNNHSFLAFGLSPKQSLQFQITKKKKNGNGFFISCCCSNEFSDDFTSSNDTSFSMESSTTMTTTIEEVDEAEESEITNSAPQRKRIRYRKEYPGESKGIVEELRFVTMRIHNKKKKMRIRRKESNDEGETLEEDEDEEESDEEEEEESSVKDGNAETWQPSIEGFLKYLVDSKLVFETVERIVDESDNVSYSYFRNTGLERSAGLAKDIEWFHQENNVIPEPSSRGVDYAKYLEELAVKSAPMFLCHYYNIYFAHISGGQVIVKQVSEKALKGRELEFNTWEGDAFELLKNVRENLNNLGENWTRDEKNRCLKEAGKSFRYLGQIIRLIIL